MDNRLESVIYESLSRTPEKECCKFADVSISRRQFVGLVEACAGSLRESGFQPGDRLATVLPNSPLMLALSLAAWKLQGSVVPLSPVAGPELISRFVGLLDPFALILPADVKEMDLMAQALSPLGDRVVRVPLDRPLSPLPRRVCRPGRPDTAVIFSTSGTTGAPKAVPLTHSNVLANLEAAKEHVSLVPEELRILNMLPNFHTFGFCLSGVWPLALGYPQVLLPSFLPPTRTIQTIYKEKISILVAVPTLIAMLCEAVSRAQLPPPGSLKRIICGGAAVPERLYHLVPKILGVPVHEGYGLTECSPVVAAVRRAEDGRFGVIGPFFPGFQHQIRDTEGRVIGGDEGVLWLKGPSVCSRYVQAEGDDNCQRFDDGWFNTGDVVRLLPEGMQIIDRANDIIIVGGYNVYPQEVENCMRENPAVADVAVVGSPNALSGEFVKAFVIPAPGVQTSERELINWCKKRLPSYKAPRKIDFVEELPRNALGKVLRRVLRDKERAAAKLGRGENS